MRLKNALLALVLLSATAFSANAATELTPEQAIVVKLFNHVVVTGRFNTIGEAVKAVSRRADKEDAASLYVAGTSDFGSSGNWRVVVDLYKVDAERVEETSNRVINGAVELPKDQAILTKPSGMVAIQGPYRSQSKVNGATTKAAKTKGAYSFYAVRQIGANQGGNQYIIVFVYKKDAKKCTVQSPDAIPVDSEAGRIALAAGGETTKRVEVLGVTTTASPSPEVGRFFET